MNWMPHIESLFTVAWVPWVMFVAMILMAICIYLYPQLIQDCFYSYISHQQRAFSQHAAKWEGSLPAFLYQVLILSFILYVWVEDTGQTSFRIFAWICLITVAYMMIRRISFVIVSYVFDLKLTKLPHVSSFNQLGLALCWFLFPIAIIAMRIGITMPLRIIILVLIGIYMVLFCFKAIIAFSRDTLMLILFIVYFITIVILPAAGAVILVQYIV